MGYRMQICADSPLPTFQSLWANITDVDISFTIPTLPGIRNPIYEGYSNLKIELSQVLQELQQLQTLTTISACLEPLASFLGGAIDDFMPSIPGTDISFTQIFTMSADALYQKIKQAILNGVQFPFIPTPMFQKLSIPEIELGETVKAVMKGYMQSAISIITDLITQVVDQLELPGLPALPTIPTDISSLKQFILDASGFSTLEEALLAGWFPISQLFARISNPEIEIQNQLSIYMSNLLLLPLQIIVDFINDTLSMLGATFPLICITL